MARSLDALQPGDLIDGKFAVQYVLGKGGMGVVVAATHLDLQETVALKFLLPEALMQKDAVERFLREARAVRKLKSEHVVKVIDVGRLSDSGLPYMAMELLAGEDLSHALERNGAFQSAIACDLLIQACDAIAEAHSVGIVHRDIKPANLFALSAPVKGRTFIKVLDFGIAKVIDAGGDGTKTQAVMGSASYMSPEQMRSSKKVDGRTDIWALGVTLYELLTARHPFEGESLPELILAITSDDPVPPRTYRPDLPRELETVVLKCLDKNPDRRFRTAGDLAAALAPFASAELRQQALAIGARGSFVEFASEASTGGFAAVPLVVPPATPSSQVGAPSSQSNRSSTAGEAATVNAFAISKSGASSPDVRPPARRGAMVGVLALGAVGLLGVLVFVVSSLGKSTTTQPASAASEVASADTTPSASAAASASARAASSRPDDTRTNDPMSTSTTTEGPRAPRPEARPAGKAGTPAAKTPSADKPAEPAATTPPAKTAPANPTSNPSRIGTSID
jgi:serine/threonine-protein kinase